MTGPGHPGETGRTRLRDLPLAARLYVCAVMAAGASCIALAVPRVELAAPLLLAALLSIGLATSTVKLPLPMMHGRSSMSLSHTVVMLTMLTVGTGAAVLLAAGTALAQSTIRTRNRSPWYQPAFNAASLALTVAVTGIAFFGLRGHDGWLDGLVGPLSLAALLYFGVNTVLVAGAVALTARRSLPRLWRDEFLWSAPGYFVGASAAGIAFELAQQNLIWCVPIIVSVYITYRSYWNYMSRLHEGQRQIEQSLNVQFETVHALALAIESRDRTSGRELRHLMLCAERLARAVQLPEPEVQAVRTAALLHDIGNLAVPEHVLEKPDVLTFEEFQKVKIHPRVGAEILKNVPFAEPVAPIILAHHEHWDGSGYPAGSKGTEIPIGARILAVADCFTALLSDRPHRHAWSQWETLATLRRSAGTVLDPTLVDRFLEILPELKPQLDVELTGGRHAPVADNAPAMTAYEDIAVARQEARALFEVAQSLTASQTVAEAVGTIVDKLGDLMSTESGILFLWDESQSRFFCRYATHAERHAWMVDNAETFEQLQARVKEQVASHSAAGSPPDVLMTRLSIGERLLGALAVVGTPPAAFRDDHLRVLEHIAHQAAIVIHNAIAFEQTRQLSLTDQLTELPNRRYLLQHLGHEFARADRLGCPVALLMMDVNGFKQVNDVHGHAAGDQVLIAIGRVAGSLLRPYDVCARYGGDEFVVVLWDCDQEHAERRRLELEQALEATSVAVGDTATVVPHISVGVAAYPVDGRRLDGLLAVADQRMYSRKSLHRGANLRGAGKPAA